MQPKTAPESQNHGNCRESKSRRPFFRSLLAYLYMHDLGWFRANLDAVAARLATRGTTLPLDEFRALDQRRIDPTKRCDIIGPIIAARGKRADSVW